MIDFVSIPKERLKVLVEEKKSLRNLEKFSNSKIKLDDVVTIECDDSLMMLRLKEVIRAFGRGFDLEDAMDLLDESYALETIDVSDFAGKSKSRQIVLKGRVIGREGSMQEFIAKKSDVKISIYGKTISIVGMWDNVQNAKQIIEKLLRGAKHSSVYRFYEERPVR